MRQCSTLCPAMTKKKTTLKRKHTTSCFHPNFIAAEQTEYYGRGEIPKLAWQDDSNDIYFYRGDSLIFLDQIHKKYPEGVFDLIFADPPYFLSNDGITCQAGRMVSVNKGKWDKIEGPDQMHAFNKAWLLACQKALKTNGTIFVSGTSHVIHSIGFAMQQLGFKILNDITWVKPNPPPNLSCRYFTHASETILWAAKKQTKQTQIQLWRDAHGRRAQADEKRLVRHQMGQKRCSGPTRDSSSRKRRKDFRQAPNAKTSYAS